MAVLSLVLVLSLLSAAFAVQASAVSTDILTDFWENPYAMLSPEALQTAQLSEEDIPEILRSNGVDTGAFVHRVRAAEDEYSLVYQKQDGTCQKFVFVEPIQYIDENGALKDKKTETKGIGNDFVTTDTDVVVKMPKSLNNGVKIKYDGLNLKMKPLGLMSKNKTFATPEGNSYRYTDTYDVFTDIVYTPTFTGVKCDIVLEEYTGRNTFRFEIHTNGYCLEKDENEKAIYVKDDDGNRILCFNPVVSYDSAGNVSFGDISFQEQNGKNKYIITMMVDEAFLTDPNTVYPVVVDPTTSSTDYAQGDLEYLCVYSNGTSFSSKSSGSRPNMLVGSSSGSVIGRVLYRFGEISAKQIIKAELVQCAWTTSDLLPMNAYAYTGPNWSSTSKYSNLNFQYASTPAMSVQYGSNYGTNSKYMRIDVTNFINLCKTNPQTYSMDKGILLINSNGEQSPEYTGMSSNVSISTSTTTATPSAACFSPYLSYTYVPFRIMLDAGHTTSNTSSGYHEGNRMWKLHLYLKTELQSKGYEVGVTRTNGAVDLGLEERGMKAAGYDMFISLHSNASNTESVNRIVVLRDIFDRNQASIFAEQIGNAVMGTMRAGGLSISAVQTDYPGDKVIYEDGVRVNYYGVLRGAAKTDCPLYYIVEHSFHTNTAVANWLMLDSNLMALAIAEADAIDNYLNA